MFPNITSKRLQYRQLAADDWRFFLSLQQDERVMRYVADPQSEDEIRRDRFEIRLPRWQKRQCTLALSGHHRKGALCAVRPHRID